MRARWRSRLSFANVASATALFVALSTGGAYATHLMVYGSDVVDESLGSLDVRGRNGTATTRATNGALTGADISGQPANPAVGQQAVQGSLTTYDVRDDTLTGVDIVEAKLARVPAAGDASTLGGRTPAQLQGARAHAMAGGDDCAGAPGTFCPVRRGKGVEYVVKVASGSYCVGVTGIDASAPDSLALVGVEWYGSPIAQGLYARWSSVNRDCVDREFEVKTYNDRGDGGWAPSSGTVFTIVIP